MEHNIIPKFELNYSNLIILVIILWGSYHIGVVLIDDKSFDTDFDVKFFQHAYAQTDKEFDYENCRSYFFERDVFVPYEINMWFEDANSGGFFYDSSNSQYSYWIEKAEDHNANEGTFMGVGSNSTERVEWQFNTKYDSAKPEGRDFTIEVISNGESIVRNTFKDPKADVCTIFNFNTKVEPTPLTNEQLIELGMTATKDEINAVKSEMRQIRVEQTQSNNYSGIYLLVVTVAVILIWLNSRNESRKIRQQQIQYNKLIDKAVEMEKQSKRSEQYYDLKLNDVNLLMSTKLSFIDDIAKRFANIEPMINNFHFILEYLKKQKDPIIELITREDKPTKSDEIAESVNIEQTTVTDSGVTESNSSFKNVDSFFHLVKSSAKNPFKPKQDTVVSLETIYNGYIEQMKKMTDSEKSDFISKEWEKWHVQPEVFDLNSEHRMRIDTLHRIDLERRK